MTTTISDFEKIETADMEVLNMSDMDWSKLSEEGDTSVFWWRVFIWTLTIIAILGMTAALFWWQIDRGVGPASTLSNVKIVRNSSMPKIAGNQSAADGFRRMSRVFPEPRQSGQYMVLAGSFVNKENAERIYNQLLAADIPVRAKQAMVNGQHHTHLLVGPYINQEAAQLAVSIIREKTGLPVDYISLDAESGKEASRNMAFMDETDENAALHPDQFFVLAGSFTERLHALRVQDRLEKKRITANIEEANEQDRTFFHVMVGPYRLAVQADNMVETIRQETGIIAETSQIL